MDIITKIVVDLSAWSDHYPSGCLIYHYDTEVDSQYCDNVDEFNEFIDGFKDRCVPYLTEVSFIFSGYDLDNDTALECAKEVWKHVHNLIYGR